MRARVLAGLSVLTMMLVSLSAVGTHSDFSAVTSNAANTFASAASFANCGYTPASISPVWMTGFEHGVTSAVASSGLLDVDWTASGTVSTDSTVKRSGNYSMKIVRPSTDTVGRSRTLTNGMVVLRLAFRFNALPAGDLQDFAGIWTNNGTQLQFGYVSSTQKMTLGFANSTKRTSSSTLAAGTWYLLDVRANYSANPHTADWQLNAVAQTQATSASAAEVPVEVWLGPDGGENVPLTMWFDDIMISQTSANYPIGDGKILGLSPDGMGTSSDPSARLSTEAGAWSSTTWNKIDDVPMTATSDYVRQTVVDATAYLEATFADTTESCMNAVMGEVAYHSSSGTANSAKTSVFDSSTERVVYSGSMASTTMLYRSAMIAPATGTWDQTKVNALKARIGFASSVGSQPYWDALMLEYNVDL
jgi:hypothetical protein